MLTIASVDGLGIADFDTLVYHKDDGEYIPNHDPTYDDVAG